MSNDLSNVQVLPTGVPSFEVSPTFRDIAEANASIKTTDIKGKEYAEVNQRIKAFRMVYPTGFIIPTMISNDDGVCIFYATVGYWKIIDDTLAQVILGQGTAYEKENSSFINKTSYIENAETSAVGRALGMAGFGIDTSVASYEEVANAIENQKDDTRPLKRDEDYYVCEECSVSEFGDDKRTAKQKKAACVKKFGQALCPRCAKEKETELKAKAEQAKFEEAAADEELPWGTEEYKEASGE